MPVVETITARLTAETNQFQAEMARAGQTTRGFSRATNTLKQGLVGLAMQATGTSGPVGKLAQALLLFGGGGPAVLGVATGIGAIALAYRGLTRDTRESAQAQEDLGKALQSLGVHAQLTFAKIELAALQTKQQGGQSFGEVMSQFLSDMTGGMFGTSREEQKQGAASGIAKQLDLIAGLTRDFTKQQNALNDAVIEGTLSWENYLAKLRAVEFKTMMMAEQTRGLRVESRVNLRGVDPNQATMAPVIDIQAEMDRLERDFADLQRGEWAAEVNESFRQLGLSAGKQFAMALIEGVQSMQDVMKSILMQFLSYGLDYVLGTIFPPSAALGGATGSAAMQSVGPASFALNVGGMPSATTPFAVMRDADWLRYLTGSLIEAKKNGFRV